MQVTVDETVVARAAERAGVAPAQADALWQALLASGRRPSRVRDVAWYGGAAVSLVACAVFLGTGWADVGPVFGLAVAAVYAVAALLVSEVLRARRAPVPAGLVAVLLLALVPVAVTAAQDLTSAWGRTAFGEADTLAQWLGQPWATVELLVLLLGLPLLARHRQPVLVAPPAVAAWAVLTELGSVLGVQPVLGTLACAGLLAGGLALDAVRQRGHALVLHLGALLALPPLLFDQWGLDGDGQALVAGLGGLAALGLGVRLERRVFLVAGALGVFGALAHLAFTVFSDSLLFPVALAALGLGVVLAGVRLDARTRAS